jgi:hypothetical protein
MGGLSVGTSWMRKREEIFWGTMLPVIEVKGKSRRETHCIPWVFTIGDVEQEAPDDKTRYAAIADY